MKQIPGFLPIFKTDHANINLISIALSGIKPAIKFVRISPLNGDAVTFFHID